LTFLIIRLLNPPLSIGAAGFHSGFVPNFLVSGLPLRFEIPFLFPVWTVARSGVSSEKGRKVPSEFFICFGFGFSFFSLIRTFFSEVALSYNSIDGMLVAISSSLFFLFAPIAFVGWCAAFPDSGLFFFPPSKATLLVVPSFLGHGSVFFRVFSHHGLVTVAFQPSC